MPRARFCAALSSRRSADLSHRFGETPVWFPTDGPLPAPLQNSAGAYRRLMGFTFVPLHYDGKLTGFMMFGPPFR